MNSKPLTSTKKPPDIDCRASQRELLSYFNDKSVDLERLTQEVVKVTRTGEKQFAPHFMCSVYHPSRDAGPVLMVVRGRVHCMDCFKKRLQTLPKNSKKFKKPEKK